MTRRLQKVEEAEVIEVGRYYLVQTVGVDMWGVNRVPLLGSAHHDKEIIGFPEEHWHIDWRFAQPSVLECGKVFFGKILSVKNSIGSVNYQRWKCIRIPPDFPRVGVFWLPKLEAAYAHKRLVNFICPHRGICVKNATLPQSDLPFDKLAVCPGHGLRWDTETGAMAPRCGPAQPALLKND